VSFTTIRYSGVPENSHSGDMLHRDSGDFADSGRADRPERPADSDRPWRHPDADPSSPCYEPDHLRHQPGDTWIIDRARPHDPDDPGPFGSPGWYPDKRTGRHRRNERPDPLPEPEAESDSSGGEAPPDRPRRSRFDSDRSSAPTRQPQRSSRGFGRDHSRRTGTDQEADMSSKPAPYRFDKLREDAWVRFLQTSEPLAAAHHQPHRPTALNRKPTPLDREIEYPFALWLKVIRWAFAVIRSVRKVPSTASAVRSVRPVSVVSPDRHTHLAARTARFAGALRGAQRARSEAPRMATGPQMREVPSRQRGSGAKASAFMFEWERQFDTNLLTGLPDLTTHLDRLNRLDRLAGGAACA
jgi:hypothetical protein